MTKFEKYLCDYFVGKNIIQHVEFSRQHIDILFHEIEDLKESKQAITVHQPSIDFVEAIWNSNLEEKK